MAGKEKRGLTISGMVKSSMATGDGIAITVAAHPPGLIDRIADAIRSGKLKTHKADVIQWRARQREKKG